MAPLDTILQVLSNPAWQGVSVIISSTISLIALTNSRKPNTSPYPLLSKKS